MKPINRFLITAAALAVVPASLPAEPSWIDDPLLGWTWRADSNWHYHPVHGWLWFAAADPASRPAYSPRWGWLWYTNASYPSAWSFNWRTWYGAEFTAGGDAWIYDHWAEAWIAASDTPLQRVQRRLPAVLRHVQGCIDDTTTRLGTNRFNYPNYTGSSGAYGDWLLQPARWWASGFFPALLWLNAGYTADPVDAEMARLWTVALSLETGNTNQYDIGLQVGLPFRRAYEVSGNASYRSGILTACNALNTRFSDITNAFRHWTFGIYGTDPNFTVIIDSLMNMEMLYWGSNEGGNPVWAQNAATHASTIGDFNVREDGSTFHWTIFNEDTGNLIDQGTHQGYADDSTWSRGQAWAIYGFSIAYRETGNAEFLDLARRVTDYFLANLPSRWIPPADFDDPAGIEAAAKDSSAAAIAASGLWILAGLDPEVSRTEAYAEAAGNILLRLSHPDYLSTEIDSESILLQGSPKYGDNDRGTIFGDYYFVEALLRWGGMLD